MRRATGNDGAAVEGREGASERIDLSGRQPAGIERPDHRSYAGADYQVGADTQAVEYLQYSNVCEALGTSTGQHQRHWPGWALLRSSGRRAHHHEEQPPQAMPHTQS